MAKITNKVSKSNGTEIISLLWFILATQVSNTPIKVVAIILGIENLIESMVFSFYFGRRTHETKDKSKAETR